MLALSLKFRRAEVGPALEKLDAALAARVSELDAAGAKKAWGIGAVAALVAVVSAVLLLVPLTLIAVVVGGFLAYSAVTTARGGAARLSAKVDFVKALVHELSFDLHPRARASLSVDLGAYDAPGKLERTARTSSGKTKQYFTDKWVHLGCVLADGTRVRAVRQQGIKRKTGSVVREKRRLFLTIQPNPRRYPPLSPQALDRIRHDVKAAIVQRFHNPPELVHVHLADRGGKLELVVAQEDAEILATEVVHLLGVALRVLSQHRRFVLALRAGQAAPR